jgi:hypothetical protein
MEQKNNLGKTNYWKREIVIFGLYAPEQGRLEEMKTFITNYKKY